MRPFIICPDRTRADHTGCNNLLCQRHFSGSSILILLPGPAAFLKIPFIVSPLNIKMLKNRGTPVRLPLCAADHAVLSAKEGENNENSNKESNQFRTFTHPDFIHGEAGPYGSDYLRYGLLTGDSTLISPWPIVAFKLSNCSCRMRIWFAQPSDVREKSPAAVVS